MAMNRTEGQTSWGWLVILYVFLAGCGGGTFLFSFILILLDKCGPVARIGALVGPLAVALGSLLLIFDLGSAARAYRLFTTPATLVSSWMMRGSWILTAFIILGLAYALPPFSLFGWLPWSQTTGLGQWIGVAAALLSIVVPVYPGLLLGVIRSIPLWNTAALPPLFFLSGLDTGVATLGLISLLFPATVGIEGFHVLGIGDMVLIVLLLVALGAYIEIVRQSGVTAAASIRLLTTPLFTIGVVASGLLLPLALLIWSSLTRNINTVLYLERATGVLILAGGLLLRYKVVVSGVRIEVR
jgi:formate-dependent nitrite reductase membrane component NrfD